MKKAEMSLLGVLIAFALILLISPAIELYNVTDRINTTENEISTALNEVIVADAIVRFDDVKSVLSDIYEINETQYIKGTFETLNYTASSGAETWTNTDKTVDITDIEIVYNEGSNSVITKYTINTPFKLLGKKVKDLKISKKNIVSLEDIIGDKKVHGLTTKEGFIETENGTVYIGSDDYLFVGFNIIDGNVYYFDENGIMQTEWISIDDKWYYASSTGIIQTGWITLNNQTYYFIEEPNSANNETYGEMATTWRLIRDKWYYFNPSKTNANNPEGSMQTGWLQVGSYWYYLGRGGSLPKGEMAVGELNIDGNYYYFYADGHMATNTWIATGITKHYYSSSGSRTH